MVTLLNRSIQRQVQLNDGVWEELMRLAKSHGWRPMGTKPAQSADLPIPEHKWDGTYEPFGQVITSEDAQNFADALDRSRVSKDVQDTLISQEKIKETIDFCRRGAFLLFGNNT